MPTAWSGSGPAKRRSVIHNIARNTEKTTGKRKKGEKKAFRACVFSKL
jgi:hypothetical protein